MRLADVLNLPWQENFEEDSDDWIKLYESLVDGAQDFLRAGGSILLMDWAGFSPLEKEAAAIAGERLRAEYAALSGLSAQGHHARVLAPADGGDAMVGESLDEVLAQMEEDLKKQ